MVVPMKSAVPDAAFPNTIPYAESVEVTSVKLDFVDPAISNAASEAVDTVMLSNAAIASDPPIVTPLAEPEIVPVLNVAPPELRL